MDRLVDHFRKQITGTTEQPKEHEPVNVDKVAKSIFSVIKGVEFTEEELKGIKRALKELMKENKDKVFVDIKITIKKGAESEPEDEQD